MSTSRIKCDQFTGTWKLAPGEILHKRKKERKKMQLNGTLFDKLCHTNKKSRISWFPTKKIEKKKKEKEKRKRKRKRKKERKKERKIERNSGCVTNLYKMLGNERHIGVVPNVCTQFPLWTCKSLYILQICAALRYTKYQKGGKIRSH